MKIVYLILDILIYFCGGVILLVGGYVFWRFWKGEVKKRQK